MDATIKAEWLEWLRSGKLKQGRGALSNASREEFCCLGVLCEVAVKHGIIEYVEGGYRSGVDGEFHYANHYLPKPVVEWAGLDDETAALGNPTVPRIEDVPDYYKKEIPVVGLAHLNDGGLSFEQIADVIEAQF